MFLKKKFHSDALNGLAVKIGDKYSLVDTRDEKLVEVHKSSRSGLTTISSVFYEASENDEPLIGIRKDHFALGLNFCKEEILAVFDSSGHGSLGGDILFLVYRDDKSIFIAENSEAGIDFIKKSIKGEVIYGGSQVIVQPSWLKSQFNIISYGVNGRLSAMVYFAANRAESLNTIQGKKGGMMCGSLYKTDWLIIDLKNLFKEIEESGELPRFVIPDTNDDKFWVLADSDSDSSEAVLISEDGVIVNSVDNYREYALSAV